MFGVHWAQMSASWSLFSGPDLDSWSMCPSIWLNFYMRTLCIILWYTAIPSICPFSCPFDPGVDIAKLLLWLPTTNYFWKIKLSYSMYLYHFPTTGVSWQIVYDNANFGMGFEQTKAPRLPQRTDSLISWLLFNLCFLTRGLMGDRAK